MAPARGNHSSSPPQPKSGSGDRGYRDALFSHAVQFFDDDAFLSGSVADFLAGGLEEGSLVIVVATGARREELIMRLSSGGFDIGMLCDTGRLVLLDADEMLGAFMVDGMPDPRLFASTIASLVGEREVRAYGEMVDLLWARGNLPAALALEKMWDELAATRRLRILCAYRMAGFDDDIHDAAFEDICGHHTHVFPTEGFPHASGDPDELRKIALLQQRAVSRAAVIGRQRELERAHRETLRELEQARQFVDVSRKVMREAVRIRDDFLSIALYELRDPLNAMHHQMLGIIRAAEQGRLPLTREWITYRIERTGEEATRLVKTLDALLDVSKMRAGQAGPDLAESNLADIVMAVVDRFREDLHEPRLVLTLAAANGLWDRTRIEQIMTQLLLNAIKYGMQEPLEIVVEATGATAVISLVDHGTGIEIAEGDWPPARLSRTPEGDDGAGFSLGLWIVRQLAESMDGEFTIASRPERGSTFSVTLPLRPAS